MTSAVAQPSAPRLPSTFAVGLARGGLELRQLFRQKDAVAFTFAMPAFLMLMLGAIFADPDPGSTVPMSHVFAASILAYGILTTAFVSMGVGVASDREDGTLKRLRGAPVTPGAYFLGKIVLVAAATVAQTVLLLTAAAVAFGLRPPTDPGRWVTFGWLTAPLGLACALLGVAAGSAAGSARSAPAVLSVPVVVLQFASGIFVHATALPGWMLDASSVFPVKWMGQGYRSVLLPQAMQASEASGSWQHAPTAAVLLAWCAAGAVLCRLTFRWHDRRTE